MQNVLNKVQYVVCTTSNHGTVPAGMVTVYMCQANTYQIELLDGMYF